MKQISLPDHPAAEEEYLRLQQACDTIDREIAEVEALTGAKAGVCMDVQMKEDPDEQEQVTIQRFKYQLDRLRQLSMASGQAYFARLDFIPSGGSPETWYLGRWGVLDPVTLVPVVVDWRSPVANLYYSGQIGRMDYEAPDGRVEGELTLKRMLTVRQRELVSLFDSGIVSQEAYLQGVLGSVSTDRLREIVTTIQAEQNIVIRHPLAANLLVQGAAGSGKTTIALHRIAYLLYTFQKTLKPENMMILAPNPLFLSYISQVLPDLGVERVVQTTFEGWCREGMGRRMPKILRESRLEMNLASTEAEREKAGRILRMKGSLRMMQKLEAWLARLQETVLPAGFKMAGVVLMERAELETVFLKDLRFFPLEQRISELKKIIRKRVQSAASVLKDRYAESAEQMAGRIRSSMRDSAQRQQKLKELYEVRDRRYREIDARAEAYLNGYRDKFPLPDVAGLYRAFLEECAPELIPEDGRLRQEDLPMLAMICQTAYGLKTKPMKHIVIDECQDFSPFQIELLKKANPAATFSLVGDLYQGIRADEGIRSWDEWKGPVFEGKADLKQLTVSYRNTVEIMDLAQAVAARYPIGGICETKPVLRHGEPPEIVRAESEKDRLALICQQVRDWRAEGWHSVALIEKTEEQAKKLFRQIGPELGAHLLSETDAEYRGGVMILPASIAKGMEFDCVGVCDASAENFPDDEFLCRILYVMMTRPLHRLRVWHKGDPSPMLPAGK
ncbi:MAG: AAA family ATPase [Clostridiales bacterium]|nr:AAA family ATPase [Clostridiales bacterium]